MASGSNIERSPHYGALQDLVDGLFAGASADDAVRRLDAVIAAEAADLPDDLMEASPGVLHPPAPLRPDQLVYRRTRLGPGLRHGGVGPSRHRFRSGVEGPALGKPLAHQVPPVKSALHF